MQGGTDGNGGAATTAVGAGGVEAARGGTAATTVDLMADIFSAPIAPAAGVVPAVGVVSPAAVATVRFYFLFFTVSSSVTFNICRVMVRITPPP